jgi:hypothetical protein
MSCNFETTPCAIPGNFVCKKCTVCGHQIGLPATLAAEKWSQILAGIKSPCTQNNPTETPGQNITGRTFAEVTANMAAARTTATTLEAPLEAAVAAAEPKNPAANLPDPFTPKPDNTGPGSQLKKFLSRIGIRSTPTCSCNARAQHMDNMGIEWCEQNLDLIVSWLKEESEKRHLPFLDWPARTLVKKAISSAKKAHAIKLKKLGH